MRVLVSFPTILFFAFGEKMCLTTDLLHWKVLSVYHTLKPEDYQKNYNMKQSKNSKIFFETGFCYVPRLASNSWTQANFLPPPPK
jgi:hypothetical protein